MFGQQAYLLVYATIAAGVNYKGYGKDQLDELHSDMQTLRGNVGGLLYLNVFKEATAETVATLRGLSSAPVAA